MPNPIKYSASAQTLALKKGNYWIGTGDVGKGPTSTTDYYNGITPPSGGYTIYLNKASGGPSIYTAANDSQLISLSNTIAGQTFATAAAALDWYNSQSDKMVFNIDYPAVVTDGLVLNVDVGFSPSYPITGATIYDTSTSSKNASLVNGPIYTTSGGGSILTDGVNDYIDLGRNFQYQDQFTVECWVRWPNTPTQGSGTACGTLAPIFTNKDWGWNIFTYSNNTISWSVYSTSGNEASVSSSGSYLNQWVQIVAYKNGTEIGLYVNSQLQGTSALGYNSVYYVNYNCGFAGNHPCGGVTYYFQMYTAIGRIYNKVLSQGEVTQNFNSTKTRFGL